MILSDSEDEPDEDWAGETRFQEEQQSTHRSMAKEERDEYEEWFEQVDRPSSEFMKVMELWTGYKKGLTP